MFRVLVYPFFKRKKNVKEDLLPQSATLGEASNKTILNIRLIKISKTRQSQGILEFSFGQSRGQEDTQKGGIKVLFHLVSLPPPPHLFQWLPKVSCLHFHLVVLFSIPGWLMELKSMTISVLLGLNCLYCIPAMLSSLLEAVISGVSWYLSER